MAIEEYRMKYENPAKWFVEEVNQPYHVNRITKCIANRDYLAGRHKVLGRENSAYKGKELITRKTILNYAKTVLKFHATYLLGKKVSFSGNENTIKNFNGR